MKNVFRSNGEDKAASHGEDEAAAAGEVMMDGVKVGCLVTHLELVASH
jgi:hypothetical protein